ncbi:MAG: hypothetical protein JW973_01470 [Bacteroidales bacterium]|nr:hypothetical protein [Bacteroidales bacterium]
MKTVLFFTLVGVALLSACTKKTENPVEGFWELQYYEWKSVDTIEVFKKHGLTRQVKVYGDSHFTWLQQNPVHDSAYLGFTFGGGGTYEMTGDTIVETNEMFAWKNGIGSKAIITYEIRGDTLIEKFPESEDDPERWTAIEVYTRLE